MSPNGCGLSCKLLIVRFRMSVQTDRKVVLKNLQRQNGRTARDGLTDDKDKQKYSTTPNNKPRRA